MYGQNEEYGDEMEAGEEQNDGFNALVTLLFLICFLEFAMGNWI